MYSNRKQVREDDSDLVRQLSMGLQAAVKDLLEFKVRKMLLLLLLPAHSP